MLPAATASAPQVGEVFKNPALAQHVPTRSPTAAATPSTRARSPRDRRLLRHEAAGCSRSNDFADHTSDWVEPVSTNYRGYDVWELPPTGQGIAALQMLNLLEPYDLKALGPDSPDYWHLLIEAKKLAYADRAKFYADPRVRQGAGRAS